MAIKRRGFRFEYAIYNEYFYHGFLAKKDYAYQVTSALSPSNQWYAQGNIILQGFIAYLAMGHFNALLVLPVGIAAYVGGYLGTHFMHRKLSPLAIRRVLAVMVLILAFKIITKIF